VTGGLSQTTRAFSALSFAPAGATPIDDSGRPGDVWAHPGERRCGTERYTHLSRELSRRMTNRRAELVMPAMKVGLGGCYQGAGVRLTVVRCRCPRADCPSMCPVAALRHPDQLRPKIGHHTLLDPIVESWTGRGSAHRTRQVPWMRSRRGLRGVYESGDARRGGVRRKTV